MLGPEAPKMWLRVLNLLLQALLGFVAFALFGGAGGAAFAGEGFFGWWGEGVLIAGEGGE